jgi:hypothetical protein
MVPRRWPSISRRALLSGDIPPYEAFALGGTNSIRGYDEGDVGSGRSYAQFTAEYRFPLFSFLGGALFFDAGYLTWAVAVLYPAHRGHRGVNRVVGSAMEPGCGCKLPWGRCGSTMGLMIRATDAFTSVLGSDSNG